MENIMPPPRHAIGVALSLYICVHAASQPADKAPPEKKQPFSISKATTRITEPVDKDGFIDYAAALNDRLVAGVTKETNAVVGLCRVFGPKPEGVRVDAEFYKRLGIDEPSERGDYFRSLDQFLDAKKKRDAQERERLNRTLEDLGVRPWKA